MEQIDRVARRSCPFQVAWHAVGLGAGSLLAHRILGIGKSVALATAAVVSFGAEWAVTGAVAYRLWQADKERLWLKATDIAGSVAAVAFLAAVAQSVGKSPAVGAAFGSVIPLWLASRSARDFIIQKDRNNVRRALIQHPQRQDRASDLLPSDADEDSYSEFDLSSDESSDPFSLLDQYSPSAIKTQIKQLEELINQLQCALGRLKARSKTAYQQLIDDVAGQLAVPTDLAQWDCVKKGEWLEGKIAYYGEVLKKVASIERDIEQFVATGRQAMDPARQLYFDADECDQSVLNELKQAIQSMQAHLRATPVPVTPLKQSWGELEDAVKRVRFSTSQTFEYNPNDPASST